MSAPQISIVIPTYKRPRDLARLLDSIQADIGMRDDVTLIVTDNDRDGSAEPVVSAFQARSGRTIDYAVEAEPGVSNARNNAMARVETRYVLFLDDDMEVVSPYLDPLMKASADLGTAITFAPAVAKLPKGVEPWEPWLAPLFSRVLEGETREVSETLGTGGCLIDLDGLALPSPPFDPALNEVGGEDDAFFAHIIAQGGTVGWCADAKAWEHVPPHRATSTYVWSRHFAFGQTPSREAADKNVFGVIKWMAVGLMQALIHTPPLALKRLMGRPSYIKHLGRVAQGVGKVFWWDSLSPRLYGRKAR